MFARVALRRAAVAIGVLAGVVGGLSLTGCGSNEIPADATPTADASQGTDIDAAWLDGGSMIALIMPGSSSCVPTAGDVSYDAGVLMVELEDPLDAACTEDYVLRGIPVTLPEGIDPADDLTIVVTGDSYRGDTPLPGAEGLEPGGGVMDGSPSAGWAGDGTLAVLTWGSSGCPPTIADAVVSTGHEVALTFADPDPARACTADMAPRVTVASVADVETGVDYTLVLDGDGYDAERVAIAGAA